MNPKAVIVTGCGRRLGRELALAAARRGFAVVGHYRRSRSDMASLKREVEALGRPLYPVAWNFSRGTKGFIARCLRFPVRVEALVNNASVYEKGDLGSSPERAWRGQLEINAFVPLLLSIDFAARVRRGLIVNLLDAGAEKFNRTFQAYRLSKRILREFTRDCALLFAPGIRVNAIAPGPLLPAAFDGRRAFLRKRKLSPLGARVTAATLAAALTYLLDRSDLTGEVLHVDGGLHLR